MFTTLLFCISVSASPAITDADWSSMGGYRGIDGDVKAIVTDGSGNIYAGGSFNVTGKILAHNIAGWDGTEWCALGSGMNGDVLALAVDDSGNVYAGGVFTVAGGIPAHYIARWNGTDWCALGDGVGNDTSAYVAAITIGQSGNVYVGGRFATAGGVTASNIAQWDGTAWSALGSGLHGSYRAPSNSVTQQAYVCALTTDSSGNLYAGGWFDSTGTTVVNTVARWDGKTWHPIGGGMPSRNTWDFPCVKALVCDVSGKLYAGGDFFLAGNTTAGGIAEWDGEMWHALDTAMTVSATSLAFDGLGTLYALDKLHYLRKWNGSSWEKVTWPYIGSISAITFDEKGTLYLGGRNPELTVEPNFASWDGSTWKVLGNGIDGIIRSLTVDNAGALYAIGQFSVIGGTSARGIARWNGSTWSAFADDRVGNIHEIASDNSGYIYVGGTFDSIGGIAARSIARWDGTTWSALDSGINGSVYSLAIDNSGNLYAGGSFDIAGEIAVQHVAKWNGTAWCDLGYRPEKSWYVYDMVTDKNGNLYIGGHYSPSEDRFISFVAQWDGSSWNNIPVDFDFGISDLAVDSKGILYAAGHDDDDYQPMSSIAQWDGSSWSALGTGLYSSVHALAVDRSDNLYAGGVFRKIGGVEVNYIAQWNGSSWNTLGSGVNHYVNTLAMDRANMLYVGGYFSVAGGNASACIARCAINEGSSLEPRGIENALPFSSFYDSSKNHVHFILEKTVDVMCNLYTLDGREVFRFNKKFISGEQIIKLPDSSIGRGMYIVRVRYGNTSEVLQVMVTQ